MDQDSLDISARPRRNRRTPAIRRAMRETRFDAGQLIYPLFVHAGKANQPIDAMPGQTRWSVGIEGLINEVARTEALGVDKVALFPKIADDLKTPTGAEAANSDGLIPQAVRLIKHHLPAVSVITDVALDPYNSDGHDGIVSDHGTVLNDETVAMLVEQALCQARAGADIVAPSDMMDGRVGVIRAALDDAGFTDTGIMAYTAKYASAFYGPFRDALDSAPAGADTDKPVPHSKTTYQMDPANAREALRELGLDEAEGADIVMVKPGLPYLDIVRDFRERTDLPVAAYQVSGEYMMIKSAAIAGAGDERAMVMEAMTCLFRAGADMVLTYFAPQIAQWLPNE